MLRIKPLLDTKKYNFQLFLEIGQGSQIILVQGYKLILPSSALSYLFVPSYSGCLGIPTLILFFNNIHQNFRFICTVTLQNNLALYLFHSSHCHLFTPTPLSSVLVGGRVDWSIEASKWKEERKRAKHAVGIFTPVCASRIAPSQ